MRNVVSISLPEKLTEKLGQEVKQENRSRSAIIREALNQHFFVKEFTDLRNNAIKELAKKGVTITEEEVFNNIS